MTGLLLGIWQAFALLIGLVLGSFCMVCIERLPLDRSLLPRSRCDACGHPIRPADLVPVLSWVRLRGRCRDCANPIPPHVPLVELLVGLLSLMLWRRLVPDVASIDAAHIAGWAIFLGFLCLLVVASYVDIRHRIIPDETSIYAIPFAILAMAFLGWIGYDGWLGIGWRSAVVGALMAGGFFTLAAVVAKQAKGTEALGWGDVKLIAMIGAFLGPIPGAFLVMMFASLMGSVVGVGALIITRNRTWMPFGPALAVASIIYVFWGEQIVLDYFPPMAHWIQ